MKRDQAWWWDRLAEWKLRPCSEPASVRDGMIAASEDFITRYHAEATHAHWQPAHLLHRRGLAWRWWSFDTAPPRITFAPRAMLFMAATVKLGLSAERDGSVRALCGAELTALRGRVDIGRPYIADFSYQG